MLPLRVDVVLGGLMAVPERHPPLLDSVLLALTGQRLELPFKTSALPVKTVRNSSWPAGDFVWLASAFEVAFVGPASDRFLHRNARPLELLDDARAHHASTVDFERGLTKITRKRYAVRQATHASAWCIADRKRVEELLGGLQALGPHRHLGLGLVRSVTVQEDAAALERCWQRPLPGPHELDPYSSSRYRCAGRATPPYWSRDLQKQAWWPANEGVTA